LLKKRLLDFSSDLAESLFEENRANGAIGKKGMYTTLAEKIFFCPVDQHQSVKSCKEKPTFCTLS
jgi:hypothetical protein